MANYLRLFDFIYEQQKNFPLQNCMTSRLAGEWQTISTNTFIEKMNNASAGLLELGVEKGDKIALITTTNRLEWNILDHAILQIGAMDIPIYPTMTEEDYAYIINHSESKFVFVSDADIYKKIERILDRVPTVKKVYTFEEVYGVANWNEVVELGKNGNHAKVKELAASVSIDDLATIIYTSGTTGLPKGVMLTHRNIASNAIDSEDRLPELEKGTCRCLSFLPCCHIYERMLHYLYINNGVSIYLSGIDTVKDDIYFVKPHMFSAVPRLLEKFFDGVVAKGMANTGAKKKIFQWALGLALQWDIDKGGWYNFQLKIARKLVFSKVKEALGLTEIKAVPSGSAALQPRLARFFSAAGITIKEGYGLTETSPVISVNSTRVSGMYMVGSVGKPINNVEVKIAQDGEILCKGPNVMQGYYKNPELTAEVLKDGWFHTGDIGEFRNGFLVITDRKKEMFKTSGGKYVAPQLIENALKESIYIEQCIVIGENRNFPAALVVVEPTQAKLWAERKGLKFSSEKEMLESDALQKLIEGEIEKRNSRFGKWEQIKAFRILPKAFTIDAGEITPTLKLKRKNIMQNYSAQIADIYRDEH
ncbi:MAG: AMP-dependent synthetase/ligase [Flavobacteriales bacterium]|jgi:long-chain acyl-CoA synthetase